MKKFFYLVLLAIVPMCFISCGGDDDTNSNSGNISSSLEGIWYLKSEKWYDCKDGKADMSKEPSVKIYEDLDERVWTFTKNGNNYLITEARKYKQYKDPDIWRSVGENEYRNHDGSGKDRLVIKSASEKTMEAECYDGYYGDEGNEIGKTVEYGILTFTR